jgi:DNA-binding CsgD family transcriptional regulator
MAGKKARQRAEREERRLKVEQLYFRLRLTQQEIAEQLGLSQPTVSRDVKAIVRQWVKEYVGDVAPIKARELGDLDAMERDCALELARTKDPRWMAERRHIKAQRARMLGLDEPQGVNIGGAVMLTVVREDEPEPNGTTEKAAS